MAMIAPVVAIASANDGLTMVLLPPETIVDSEDQFNGGM